MKNFYKTQPPYAFWSKSVNLNTFLDPVVIPKFKIESNDKVASAGSCFAQRISHFLQSVGFPMYIAEEPHPLFTGKSTDFQYGIYTARYGNIYTSRQLLQLIQRAFGHFKPSVKSWKKGDVLFDPFRPGIPSGFINENELIADRDKHLKSVRNMFESLDFFIFTLGLTEAWVCNKTGAVFPSAPGVLAGEYDENEVSFCNLSIQDVIDDLNQFIQILKTVNSKAKIIFTVSPVPLVATATNHHVLVATTISKSILRTAVDILTNRYDFVDYFPSYEIINSPTAQGAYFSNDLRSVTPEGVSHVMNVFGKHYLSNLVEYEYDSINKGDIHNKSIIQSVVSEMDLVCEEINNETFTRE